MQRFYYADFRQGLIPSDHILYHQITRVLRSRVGMQYSFFDGNGSESTVQVTSIDRRSLGYEIIQTHQTVGNPKRFLTLYQALPNKYEKGEYLIEKGIECGVSSFVFFASQYSQIKQFDEKKFSRFQRIAQEAVEQSLRSDIVHIGFESGGLAAIVQSDEKLAFLHTGPSSRSLGQWGREHDSLSSLGVIVGPEGGFHPSEIQLIQESSIESVSLGNRILRLETVAPVVGYTLLSGE